MALRAAAQWSHVSTTQREGWKQQAVHCGSTCKNTGELSEACGDEDGGDHSCSLLHRLPSLVCVVQYWSRDLYSSLCEMLREAEKKDTNKVRGETNRRSGPACVRALADSSSACSFVLLQLTVWSKVESASIDNQLWHRSVPPALLNPTQHFGVSSALLSSSTREWLPALGVDMSRPPALKLTGWTHTKPTRCTLSAKRSARLDAALIRAQRVAPSRMPSPAPSQHEVPEAMLVSDDEQEWAQEKKVSTSDGSAPRDESTEAGGEGCTRSLSPRGV